MKKSQLEKIIQQYPQDYCLFLEAAYGKDMMSEGGTAAIDRMFNGEKINGTTMLEIGFGLGGAAFHLATHHQTTIHGIEVNPWLVDEAIKRTPKNLKQQVFFQLYNPDEPLAFPAN